MSMRHTAYSTLPDFAALTHPDFLVHLHYPLTGSGPSDYLIWVSPSHHITVYPERSPTQPQVE